MIGRWRRHQRQRQTNTDFYFCLCRLSLHHTFHIFHSISRQLARNIFIIFFLFRATLLRDCLHLVRRHKLQHYTNDYLFCVCLFVLLWCDMRGSWGTWEREDIGDYQLRETDILKFKFTKFELELVPLLNAPNYFRRYAMRPDKRM